MIQLARRIRLGAQVKKFKFSFDMLQILQNFNKSLKWNGYEFLWKVIANKNMKFHNQRIVPPPSE